MVRHLTGVQDSAGLIGRDRLRARRRGRPDDAISVLVDIATDAIVAVPTARWAARRAESVARAGGRVYRYRVDYRGAGPTLGATHTAEVPLLFGTWDDGGPGERLCGQAEGTAEVARELVSAWARFIHGEAPGWGALTPGDEAVDVGVFGGSVPLSLELLALDHDEIVLQA